jgi:hypothetical protein
MKNIAQRIAPQLPPCIALGALINVGVLGLIDASQKDDPTCATPSGSISGSSRA